MNHTPPPWIDNDPRWPNAIVAPKALPGPMPLARVAEIRYCKPADRRLLLAAPALLSHLYDIIAAHDAGYAAGVPKAIDKCRPTLEALTGDPT